MKSATTASTAIPQPAIAIPVWPVGHELAAAPRGAGLRGRARARRSSSRSRSRSRRSGSSSRRGSGCAPVGTSSPAGGLAEVAQLDAVLARRARPARGRRRRTRAGRSRGRGPARTQSSSRSRHAGGKRPPCVATPTSAVVGSSGARRRPISTTGKPSSVVPGVARRVEERDDVVGAVAHARRARSCRSAGRPTAPRRGSSSLRGRDTEPRARRRAAAHRRRTRRPATGRAASSRLPSRSTWSMSDAMCAPAAMPSPDSTMQPSITPSPSARAACTIRTASRMPPDFASLMLIPCARSAQAATSASVWQSSST